MGVHCFCKGSIDQLIKAWINNYTFGSLSRSVFNTTNRFPVWWSSTMCLQHLTYACMWVISKNMNNNNWCWQGVVLQADISKAYRKLARKYHPDRYKVFCNIKRTSLFDSLLANDSLYIYNAAPLAFIWLAVM